MDTPLQYATLMRMIQLIVIALHMFVHHYILADLFVNVFGEKATVRQKAAFALAVGALRMASCAMALAALIGFQDYTHTEYTLAAIPTPVLLLFEYYLSIRILKLPRHRSAFMMFPAYLASILICCLMHVFRDAFFYHGLAPSYNYILETVMLLSYSILLFIVYRALLSLIRRKHFMIRQLDGTLSRSPRRQVLIAFSEACVLYLFIHALPLTRLHGWGAEYIIASLALIQAMIIGILLAKRRALRLEARNKAVYIGMLQNAIESFRGVKHDFYNILQSYSGYIMLGSLEELKAYHKEFEDATRTAGDRMIRMPENPALINLIAKIHERAEEKNVMLSSNIIGDVRDMLLADDVLVDALGQLLTGAVDAAALSQRRFVHVLVENKDAQGKLVVISHSAPPPAHDAKSFDEGDIRAARRMLADYKRASLMYTVNNCERTYYLELESNSL